MLSGLRQASRPVLALPRHTKRIIVLLVDTSFCVLLCGWLFLAFGEFVSLSGNASGQWHFQWFALPIFIVSGLYQTIFRYSGYPSYLRLPAPSVCMGCFMRASSRLLELQLFRVQWG